MEKRERPAIAVRPTCLRPPLLRRPGRRAPWTVARDGLSVRNDIDVLAAGLPLGERASGARHLSQQAFQRHADAFDLLQVLAEDFDADRRADPSGQHVDARPDRRRDGHW